MNDVPDGGKVILLYGETGVGKTTSVLKTIPTGSLYISTEPRNPKISMKAANRKLDDVRVYEYNNWLELIGLVNDKQQMAEFANKCVVVDSLSYLMNVRLSNEIEDETFDAQDDERKAIKTIISSSKMSQEGFGGLASQMSRLTKALGDLTKQGTDIILVALLAEHPKWDRDLSAAPALKGIAYPSNLPGSCDLIGYVRSWSKDGRKQFPPLVYFEANDDEYLAKFTGVRPDVDIVRIPLDLGIILGNKKKGGEKDATNI
jgi:hypothetical protein